MTIPEVMAVAKAIYARRHDALRVDEAFEMHAQGKLRGDVRNVKICIETARTAIRALDAHRGVNQ